MKSLHTEILRSVAEATSLRMTPTPPRTNEWLRSEAKLLWKNFFADAPKKNTITVQFGRPARARLGSIRLTRKKTSKVIMNGLFRNHRVPVQVVQGILAHEFTHYIQGFGSELPKLSRHPHRCRLVDEEMKRRGLANILEFQKKWIKANWENFVKKNLPRIAKRPKGAKQFFYYLRRMT